MSGFLESQTDPGTALEPSRPHCSPRGPLLPAVPACIPGSGLTHCCRQRTAPVTKEQKKKTIGTNQVLHQKYQSS